MSKDLFKNLSAHLARPEKECMEEILSTLSWDAAAAQQISQKTYAMITAMRGVKRKAGSIESFFQTYSLSTKEGLALMTLAEALLRIPDSNTSAALIRDKIMGTDWSGKEEGEDWLLRLASLGLSGASATLDSPLSKLGEPVIRKALGEGMKILGGQFVMGQTIEEALKNAAILEAEKRYLFSFDMLGEGARTIEDADHYFAAYNDAIEAIGTNPKRTQGKQPGISVKLSALYPRYSKAQEEFCVPHLTQKLSLLCRKAAGYNIALSVDAEEVDRLETSLKIMRTVFRDITLTGWEGFGIVVQAYGKRTLSLIDDLIAMAEESGGGRRLQVRLVKGAYWDSEIKRAQVKGLSDYPVFTRKVHTDLSYLACAKKLLQARDVIYPMFGTHNAYTVQAILALATSGEGFEFQRLFGMGDALYDIVLKEKNAPVRIYAPVGVHRDLLPYLVRRLLENGANSSFVGKVFDSSIPPQQLARDVVEAALEIGLTPHPSIPLPRDIFEGRHNSKGLDLDDSKTLQMLQKGIDAAFDRREVICASLIDGRFEKTGNIHESYNPSDRSERIGTIYAAHEGLVQNAFVAAEKGWKGWKNTSAARRAEILNKCADLMEENLHDLMALCVHEAGKTLADAISEVREAVDFCRYYAALGIKDFDENGQILRSYTGECNNILLQGRGIFVCISPWNFPLAIFMGQVAAALMAGNAVLAKPAEQTPFIALMAVKLLHRAGVPDSALHLVIGDGRVGEMLVQHEKVAGVAFTGSNTAAWSINRTLAAKNGAIVPFIAETGGQNAMIMDSSALPEQVVDDVILSAFGSAGQRCSAARVLFVQEEVADKTIKMLQGAMAELRIGNPRFYATDIGPLIDEEALARLTAHKRRMEGVGKFIAAAPMSEELRSLGHYFAPIAYEIADLSDLEGEVFGPALHVIRFKGGEMEKVIAAVNGSGYGLTFGLHTRVEGVARAVSNAVEAGNIYINRSIIGAVVGVQPFGGSRLSGTGPKAGGPHYLHRFATEKVISVNTTASGGNTSLVMLEE